MGKSIDQNYFQNRQSNNKTNYKCCGFINEEIIRQVCVERARWSLLYIDFCMHRVAALRN